MKNFRKVLALVLVVATLFSFTAMTSATNIGEYEDWSKVSYAEAVDVLSAVGILNGYEDDTFKPTNTISREEMAKMIAVLANSGEDVSTLYASACTFADVATTKWSASYVAYCAKTGIVAGRSATTFDPAGKVTGLETAKMLLVVLGFDAEKQGYVGADWKVNVLRDAKTMSLLDGFAADYDVDAAITREEAAQMMMNALLAPCVVGVLSDGIVTVTNALIASWNWKAGISELFDISVRGTLKDAIKAGKWCLYGNVVISNDLLVDTLFKGLKKSTLQMDCFGRPSSVWTWTKSNGKVETLALTAAAPIWKSTDTTKAAVEKVLKDNGLTLKAYYVDGEPKAALNDDTGKLGTLVEVYADGTVVEIHTYIGTIGQINTRDGEFEIKDVEGKTVKVADALNDYGFTVKDEGKVVLYWICGDSSLLEDEDEDNVHDVKVIDPTVVTVHAVREAAGNFCDTNEDIYEAAEKAYNGIATKDMIGKEIAVYTDAYGNVMYWKAKTTASNYGVLVHNSVKGTDPVVSNAGTTYKTWKATFVEFAGDAEAAEMAEQATVAATLQEEEGAAYKDLADVLVTYDVSSGKYVNVAHAGIIVEEELVLAPNVAAIVDADKNVVVEGKFLNKSSEIVLRVWNYNDAKYEYKYFDGNDEIDATYKLDKVQYVAGEDTFIDYLYAEAEYVKSAKLAYIIGAYTDETTMGLYVEGDTTKSNELTYYLYKAIVNGEEAIVAYEATAEGKDPALKAREVYSSSYALVKAASHDELPIYVAGTKVSVSSYKDFCIEDGTLVYKDSNAVIGNNILEDATIYVMVYDQSDKAVTPVEVAQDELVNYLTVHGWVDQMGGYVGMADGKNIDTLFVMVEKP